MSEKVVMVVDDSSLARMMLRQMIAEKFPNWKLIEATGSDEALIKASQTHLDLALVDYNMPVMNGLDLAILLLEQYPGLQIHLVTANIQDKMRQKAEAVGLGFIIKPLAFDKIKVAFDLIG